MSRAKVRSAGVSAGALLLASLPAFALGFAPAHAGTTVMCLGKAATLVGTEGPDVLVGTDGADVILGLGGSDVIRGLGGNDRVCGGDGNDRLVGGDGRDRLAGEANPQPDGQPEFPVGDVLAGGEGSDVLYGGDPVVDDSIYDAVSYRRAVRGVDVNLAAGQATGEGNDTLAGFGAVIGSTHPDLLRGIAKGTVHAGGGDDELISVSGRETLSGGSGADRLLLGRNDSGSGDAGDDVLRIRRSGDAVAEGGPGDDTLVGGAGDDTLYDFYGETDSDVARGSRGDDVIGLLGGADASFGGGGSDEIFAGPGSDLIDGGPGRDTFSGGFLNADGFTVNLRRGTATGGGTGIDRLTSVVDVTGSFQDDVLIGNRHRNVMFAGPGADRMSGGRGNDDLDGDDDQDRADGGPGSDACIAERRVRCEG